MPGSDYEILQYRPEYKHEVASIEKYLWGTNIDLNLKYLEWKYEQNPYQLQSSLFLSRRAGKIIGATGFSWGKWQIGKSSITFMLPGAGDSAIDPEHRKLGLFNKMNTMALEAFAKSNIPYTFSFSANPISLTSFLMSGWHSAGKIEIGYRLPASYHLNERSSLISRYAYKINNRLNAGIRALRFSSKQEPDPFKLVDTEYKKHGEKYSANIFIDTSPRSDEMTALIERIEYNGRLRHVRDHEFFNWRFKNPFSRYRFLYYFEKDINLAGYLILRASAFSQDEDITIVDLESLNDHIRTELLKAAVYLCRNTTLVIWTHSLSPECKSTLEDLNFIFSKGGRSVTTNHPNILIYAIRQDSSDTQFIFSGLNLMDPSSWDLRAIYSDVF